MISDIVEVAWRALATELFATAIYRHLAEGYPERETRKAFRKMVGMEEWHTSFWTDFLMVRGVDPSGERPSRLRLALYKLMFRLVGRGLTLRMMEASENQAVELYSSILEGPELSEGETRGLSRILEDELVHEKLVQSEESKFEGFMAYVKDAILGMNDGLVGTLSVTTGLAGASGTPMAVAIGGLIVGVAGGVSMGISAYTSSRAQRQVNEGILKRSFQPPSLWLIYSGSVWSTI